MKIMLTESLKDLVSDYPFSGEEGKKEIVVEEPRSVKTVGAKNRVF